MSGEAQFEPQAGLQNDSSPKPTQDELRKIAMVDSIVPGATEEEIKQGEADWEAYLKTHSSITGGRLRGANGRFTTKEAAASFYHTDEVDWAPEPSAAAHNFARKIHLLRDKYQDVPAPITTQVVRVVTAQEATPSISEKLPESPRQSTFEPTPIYDELMAIFGQSLPNRTIRLIPEPITELHGLHRQEAAESPQETEKSETEPQEKTPPEQPTPKSNDEILAEVQERIQQQIDDTQKPPAIQQLPEEPQANEKIQASSSGSEKPVAPLPPPKGPEQTEGRERRKYGKRLVVAALAIGTIAALAWMGNNAVDNKKDSDSIARPPQNPAAAASPTPGISPESKPNRPQVTDNDRPVIKFSKPARTVEPGEGFYQTFKEMGVPAEDRPRLLQKVGPMLAKIGLAYKMPDGLWGISRPGQLPEDILELINKKR